MKMPLNKMGEWGNVWFNCFVLDEGDEVPCHSHEHEHVTLIGHGSVEALIDGQDAGVFVKGEACPVGKNIKHGYRALEDGTTLFCTFAVRKKGEDDPVSWEDALRLPTRTPKDSYQVHKNFFKKDRTC